MAMIPVDLTRILITETSEQQVIWLKEHDGERSFPIVIGIFEALAIKRKLNDEEFERPLTHDLLVNVLDELDTEIERIVICSLKRTTFYANIILNKEDGESVEIDARPSDAIALAVRVNAPLFVEEDVFDMVGKPEISPDE